MNYTWLKGRAGDVESFAPEGSACTVQYGHISAQQLSVLSQRVRPAINYSLYPLFLRRIPTWRNNYEETCGQQRGARGYWEINVVVKIYQLHEHEWTAKLHGREWIDQSDRRQSEMLVSTWEEKTVNIAPNIHWKRRCVFAGQFGGDTIWSFLQILCSLGEKHRKWLQQQPRDTLNYYQHAAVAGRGADHLHLFLRMKLSAGARATFAIKWKITMRPRQHRWEEMKKKVNAVLSRSSTYSRDVNKCAYSV